MYRAIESFACASTDGPRFVVAGELVDTKDPVRKGREALFEKVDEDTPKKKRSTKRTAKKPVDGD